MPSKNKYLLIRKRKWFILLIFSFSFNLNAQIANYVSNGSFEEAVPSYPPLAKSWKATDTVKFFGELLSKILLPYDVPHNAYGYQWPKHGNNYLISLQYCPGCGSNKRGYPVNRLKKTLEVGKVYCVNFYISLANQSTHGIDAIGAYFSDNTIDTIIRCNYPITYFTPQIQNPSNNIITDTLNWVPITGTFVANGSEKYMMIGNFKSDTNTHKILTNPTNLPMEFSEYLIDGVSCIELNLPAYAGPDKSIAPGDSVYLGRELDFAVDSGCTWYKLPNLTTPIKIASGLWVKPIATSTYVVKQVLDCSPEKWDTVVVYMNLVGLEKLKVLTEELRLYPVPSKDYFELSISNETLIKDFTSLSIFNNLGFLVRKEEVNFKDKSLKIGTSDLTDGVYLITLNNPKNEKVIKKLIIAK